MKLLLVQPAGNYIIKTNEEQGAKLCVQPLGLLYIASFLRKNIPDIEIKVLDCQVEDFNNEKHIRSFRNHKIIRYGLSEENIQKIIEDYEPDVVAISCLQCTRMHEAHEIAKITKKASLIINKRITTIMGGQYATSLYDIAIQDKNLDYCILGEGEYPLYYLLHNMTDKSNNKQEYYNNKQEYYNVVKNSSNDTILNQNTYTIYPKHPTLPNIIENLNIHFPAWDLIDLKKYSDINLSPNRKTKNKNFAIGITSRGCSHTCSYCPARNIFGTKWRYRSTESIIQEIEYLKNNYNITEFQFEDSDILASKSRMTNLCKQLETQNINWCSPHGMAVQKLTSELLKHMKDSGCYALHLSVEFGSEQILKQIKPTVNLKHAKNIVKCAKKLDMDTTIFTMIGHPSETRKNIKNTINYTLSLEPDAPYFFCMQPMPRTEFYNFCKTNNHIVDDFEWSNLRYSLQNLKVKNLNDGELESIRRETWLKYMDENKKVSKYDFWRE